MNLLNKEVKIVSMSSIGIPMETKVQVEILEEQVPGIKKIIERYELDFDSLYNGPSDPQLLLEIQSKLEAIP
jgi:hypothetical protein